VAQPAFSHEKTAWQKHATLVFTRPPIDAAQGRFSSGIQLERPSIAAIHLTIGGTAARQWHRGASRRSGAVLGDRPAWLKTNSARADGHQPASLEILQGVRSSKLQLKGHGPERTAAGVGCSSPQFAEATRRDAKRPPAGPRGKPPAGSSASSRSGHALSKDAQHRRAVEHRGGRAAGGQGGRKARPSRVWGGQPGHANEANRASRIRGTAKHGHQSTWISKRFWIGMVRLSLSWFARRRIGCQSVVAGPRGQIASPARVAGRRCRRVIASGVRKNEGRRP